ncbi:hypothetical protein [Tissierella praeacuta]|uniref:hypothetical protein n=1 Tax=Tissierella praeacuta TaxID=43131 RepID=UPI00333F60EB
MYKQSGHWDTDISLHELIIHNKTCKINLDSTHHFETYEGVLIYVSHPDHKEKFTIQLGVDEEGIMYEGDYGCEESFKEIPIKDGVKILNRYRQLVNEKNRMESTLLDYSLGKDTVHIALK